MQTPRTNPDRYIVEAVARALDILEVFAGGEELALKPIAERVGLGRSRAFRLLHTLVQCGYVERSPDGKRYSLGVKLFERAASVRRSVRQAALPQMRALHGRFNETVNLGILDAGEIVYVEMLESTQPFRMAAAIGTRSPAHACALGKAMLAFLPEAQAATVLAAARDVKLTERTTTDGGELARELRRVRQHGYALDVQETEFGVACVGGVVLERGGWPVAGISVSGPANRVLSRRAEIAAGVVAACEEISRGLGYAGAPRRQVAAARTQGLTRGA